MKWYFKELFEMLFFGIGCGMVAIGVAVVAGVMFRIFRWAAGF